MTAVETAGSERQPADGPWSRAVRRSSALWAAQPHDATITNPVPKLPVAQEPAPTRRIGHIDATTGIDFSFDRAMRFDASESDRMRCSVSVFLDDRSHWEAQRQLEQSTRESVTHEF